MPLARHLSRTFAVGLIVLLGCTLDAGHSAALPMPPLPQLPQTLADMAKSLGDVAGGLVRGLPGVIPSPAELFSLSKNVVAGYPLEAVLTAVNVFCA